MTEFLDINGNRVVATQDEVVGLGLAVAAGSLTDVAEIAARLGKRAPGAG